MNVGGLFDELSPRRAPPRSVYERCAWQVQAAIRALALPGLRPAAVAIRTLPSLRESVGERIPALPAVLVCPLGRESNETLAATNRSDTVGYPVGVAIVAAADQMSADRRSLYLVWRERIVRAFRHQRLAGVDEVLTCVVEPEPVVAAEAWLRNVWHSAVVLRFIAREPRGS
ncbi:MAG: hypothetical protein JSS27_02545 [Planctomycetes bacterium]|nr:hypothetical protein [Planctomycetota bacterium]